MIALAALALLQAQSPEIWTCIQASYGNGPPMTLHFVIEGDVMSEGRYRWPYHVVHNTETEIIATYPAVGTTQGRRTINARTIVIDKRTGDMIASNIDLWADAEENRPITGHCGRG